MGYVQNRVTVLRDALKYIHVGLWRIIPDAQALKNSHPLLTWSGLHEFQSKRGNKLMLAIRVSDSPALKTECRSESLLASFSRESEIS